jgi:hypothetical protein
MAAQVPVVSALFQLRSYFEVKIPSSPFRQLPSLWEFPNPRTIMPTILIIDDEKELCVILENLFSSEGFRVLLAPDGNQGVRLDRRETSGYGPCVRN